LEIANVNFPASDVSKTVDCVSVATIRKVLIVCVKILGNFLVISYKLGIRDFYIRVTVHRNRFLFK
jgi:hypothetical protein